MRTPLYDFHRQRASKMVEFHGWEMPLLFSGIVEEHETVRTQVALFDVSHMGKLVLVDPGPPNGLQTLIPSRLPTGPGVARYTHLLQEEGTILDDAILVGLGAGRYLCVCNAGPRERVVDWFRDRLDNGACMDRTEEMVCLALQGPEAQRTLQPLVDVPLEDVPSFRGRSALFDLPSSVETEGWGTFASLLGTGEGTNPAALYLTRTGYTGEDGVEIYAPNELGRAVWHRLTEDQGVPPAGLGARDTLRLEKGYLLSGQDFDGSQTPLQVGYERIVHWDHEFVGREALLRQKERGGYPRLKGIRLRERGVPRHGHTVWAGEERVGQVTSGTLSPSLGVGIALGYLEPPAAHDGTRVKVEIRGARRAADVVSPPFL